MDQNDTTQGHDLFKPVEVNLFPEMSAKTIDSIKKRSLCLNRKCTLLKGAVIRTGVTDATCQLPVNQKFKQNDVRQFAVVVVTGIAISFQQLINIQLT